MKLYLKSGFLLVSLGALASSPDPALYQYWFDKDESSRAKNTHVYDALSNPLNIDASALSEGGHAVNYRMADKDKKWGTVMTKYFVVPPVIPEKDSKESIEPVLYQYWFDNEEASRVKNTKPYDAQSKSLDVDASGLSEGGHAFKYRMANKYNQWGSVLTRYFVVPSTASQKDPKDAVEPVLMQYWFDNDEASRLKNTKPYDAQSKSLDFDVSGLSEGGHAFKYRMANKDNQWGSVLTRYFVVPGTPDPSSSKAVAYRVWVNTDVVASGSIPSNSDFSLTADIPDNPTLSSVDTREFTYRSGEKTITMVAEGKFTCAFQMLSENNEWGMPISSEYDHSVSTKLPVDSVPVPYDFTFKKPDKNSFKAYNFYCGNTSDLYFKASQDCTVGLYDVNTSSASNLNLLKTLVLKKGETTKCTDTSLRSRHLVAIVYDTKNDVANKDEDIFLRIMYEDNKLPKPVISFDPATWEVSITCADQRAKIHYTIDGNLPTHDSPVYEGPVKLEKFTRVQAIAVYGDLADSNVADLTISDKEMRIPRPELVFVGGVGMNEFIFTNDIEGVTTYYVLGSGDLYDEAHRKTFDGKPFVIADGTALKAYSVKDQLADSEVLSLTVKLNDYVTPAPKLAETKTEGDAGADYMAIRNFLKLSIPEGNAKYRILTGKQIFENGEEIDETQWTACGEDWIELPGGPFSGNQTLQAFSSSEGKARSAVVSIYTDWVKALKPVSEFDNNHLKLSTNMPDAVIKYNTGNYNPASALVYKAEELPDGIDFSDITMVTAWTEAEGYTDSDRITVSGKDYDIPSPLIRYEEDGYLHITHELDDAEIIVKVVPEQKLDTISQTHLRFIPEYNSRVEAYAKKKGFNDSQVAVMNPVAKPVINVDAYRVTIDYSDGDVYYTVDGEKPTKLSAKYKDPFETVACTVRAVAFKDGMIPAEADSVKVMDQAAMPEIDIVGGFARLTTSTPGATIYYSLNQGISDGNRKTYDEESLPNGIDMSEVRTLYAYAEAEGFRRSETLDFFKSDFTLSEPTLKYSNGYVVAEHEDASVEICFADGDGNVLQPEAADPWRVKVAYNSVVDAYASKKGYIASKSVRIEHTDLPVIIPDLFTVSIKAKTGQTVRYTVDGSQPDASSALYTEPFTVEESCTVRAVAFEDDLIPAEGEPKTISYSKTQSPVVDTYNGRYLTLSAETGATIKYVIGNTDLDISDWKDYSGELDIQGLQEIRAFARRSDADPSEVMSFTPSYYADDTDVYTTQAGSLEKAFEWCSDKSEVKSLNVHGVLTGNMIQDSGDYEFIRTFPAIRHLDLHDVSDKFIPGGALNMPTLISVILPAQLSDAGRNVFGDVNSTLCAVEVSGDGWVPDDLFSGLQNTNILVYARSANDVSKAVANTGGIVSNVVVLGGGANGSNTSAAITLNHAYPFHAPKEFEAKKISYMRSFDKETSIDGLGSGWETLSVPFNVQAIESAGRTLKPFGEAETGLGECPFWLFKAADTEWKMETDILANAPYLIAMPNNPLYSDEYVVKGDVVFSANNVTVAVTPSAEEMTYSFGVGRSVVGNYSRIPKGEGVLAVNESTVSYKNQEFLPGGIFISNERDVVPFECYVTNAGAKAIPIFDQSGIEDLFGDYGVRIWSESYSICIRSSIAMKIRIYDMVGQLIRTLDVTPGETVRVDGITPGIYFVGNTKILVKG